MRKTMFWIVTGLFAAFMAFGGLLDTFSADAVKQLASLGYPAYFAAIIGVAKLLGALALVVRRYRRLTEWAYAGFTFDLIGAAWSILASGGGWSALMVLPFAALLFASYRLAPARGTTCACADCAGHA